MAARPIGSVSMLKPAPLWLTWPLRPRPCVGSEPTEGDYRPFVVAAVVAMTASLLMKAYSGDLVVFWAGTLIASFALGAYYSIDLALVLRTLPAGEEGKYLGIFNLAKTIPQSVAPALAPLVLTLGGPDPVSGHARNYASLYLTAAVAVALSLAVLPGLRPVLRRDPDLTPLSPLISAPIKDASL